MTRRTALTIALIPGAFLTLGSAQVRPLASIRDTVDPSVCLSLQEVTYAPGQGSKPHTHTATIIAYVLRGAIDSKIDDGPIRTYRPGERWIEPAGARHAVSRNATADRPATFLAIMVAHRGAEEAKACDGPEAE